MFTTLPDYTFDEMPDIPKFMAPECDLSSAAPIDYDGVVRLLAEDQVKEDQVKEKCSYCQMDVSLEHQCTVEDLKDMIRR